MADRVTVTGTPATNRRRRPGSGGAEEGVETTGAASVADAAVRLGVRHRRRHRCRSWIGSRRLLSGRRSMLPTSSHTLTLASMKR